MATRPSAADAEARVHQVCMFIKPSPATMRVQIVRMSRVRVRVLCRSSRSDSARIWWGPLERRARWYLDRFASDGTGRDLYRQQSELVPVLRLTHDLLLMPLATGKITAQSGC
jgi:hypothetical protein